MTSTRTQTLDVAERLFAAIESGDIAALTALWSDDVVVWRQGGGRERDKPRALSVIEWFVDATTERRYEVLDRAGVRSLASSSSTSCTPPRGPAKRWRCGSAW